MKLQDLSMRWKATGLLLTVGLIPLCLAVWFGGLRSGDALMIKAADQLRTVRQIKKNQVEALFERRRQDVSILVDTVGTLRTEAFRKLTTMREDRKSTVTRYLKTIENQIVTLAEQPVVVEAAKGFRQHAHAFRKENGVDGSTLERMRRELATYYAGEFSTEYRRRNDGRDPPTDGWFARLDDDSVALQYYYIRNNPHPLGAKHQLDRHADDRSAYGRLHAQTQPILRNYQEKLGFYDILIADPDSGRIVYSAFKELDFSLSLKDGAIAGSNLAVAFRQANQADQRGTVVVADFAAYWPSYMDPAGFVASPIFDGNQKVGILLFQFPIDNLNAIMTERAGQGRSGETYLVGPDRLMRSNSFLDPVHRSVAASFRNPEKGRVETEAVRSALAGESNTRVIRDYNGNPVLSAWAPITAMGLHWALVAEVDVAEAFVHLDDQGRSFLARYAEKYGYRDLLLINPDGYVFHSVARTPVLGTNLLNGIYADSHLGDLFRRILATGGIGFADLAPYAPRDGKPAFFVAQSAVHRGQLEVVVALEMPLEAIDQIMNQREGMGKSGETYLVGRHQGRISYRNNRVVELARIGDSDSDAASYGEKALNGETGSMQGVCRDGEAELVDFAPLDIAGLNWAIVGVVRVDEVRGPVRELLTALVLAGCALAGLIIVLAWLMARGLVRPLVKLKEATTAMAAGDLTIRSHVVGRDEAGQVGVTFDLMAHRIEEQHWLNVNLTHVVGILQQSEDTGHLADALLRGLVPLLSAGHGVLYLLHPASGRYELLGNFRHSHQDGLQTSFAPGEGVVGRCVSTGQTLRLDGIPAEALRIGYGLGAAQPVSVLIVPVSHQDKVLAVLEIASFHAFTPVQQALLEALVQRLGLTLENLRQARETRDLLRETQHQAEELQTQAEELETQQEELRQINATLERQTDALKVSEEELKFQQEELRGTNESLTERTRNLEKRTEELEAARRDLERSNQYKSDFLANMSHELRTPLNSLLILAKSLADNETGNLTAEQVRDAGMVHESGVDLLNLINEILDLSKIEAGHMEILPRMLEIPLLAANLVRKFRPVAINRGIDFTVEVADDAPLQLRTDVGKVERILDNLMANACKFTRQGSVTVRVAAWTKAATGTNGLAVAVTDTGIGIPADKQGIVFETFRQADDGTSREFGGTGLGLSIASRLATMLGGEIHLVSREGEGSVFTLHLPEYTDATSDIVLPDSTPADNPDDREQVMPGDLTLLVIEDNPESVGQEQLEQVCQRMTHVAGRKIRRLLLVEDDPASRAATTKLIVDEDLVIHEASRGEEALALLRRESFDCMILDLGLPDITGFKLLDRLAADRMIHKPPVVVYSGRELTRQEYDHLKQYTDSIVIKGVRSAERLLDEVVLFLHRVTGEQVGAQHRTIHKSRDAATVFKDRKVLLVDDDVRGTYALSRGLEAKGLQVIMAANGRKALEMLDNHPETDLVLMDIMMPSMDGFQTIRRIREQERFGKLPIIALTAKAMSGDRNKCLEAGASDYCSKPVEIERLLAMIRVWLDQRGETTRDG